MSNTDESKAAGKSGQRKGKPRQQSKKPDQRSRAKPDQQADLRQEDDPQADLRQEEKELVEAEVAPEETFAIEAEALAPASPIVPAVASIERPSRGTLVPIDAFPPATASIDTFFNEFQAIANAYRDYARRSIEETFSFVERLAAVRSPDKAVELQSEFAKQACGTFLSDSQKIWRLYGELARQVFRPFERLVMRMTQTAR